VRLRLRFADEEFERQLTRGDGPIDAIFLAIEEVTGVSVVCKDFRVQAVTVGKDAQGEVNVEVQHAGQTYRGRGVSTDSVEASAKAFLNAINRVIQTTGPRLHPQHSLAVAKV
jgi:2-isopropylmalate synthase